MICACCTVLLNLTDPTQEGQQREKKGPKKGPKNHTPPPPCLSPSTVLSCVDKPENEYRTNSNLSFFSPSLPSFCILPACGPQPGFRSARRVLLLTNCHNPQLRAACPGRGTATRADARRHVLPRNRLLTQAHLPTPAPPARATQPRTSHPPRSPCRAPPAHARPPRRRSLLHAGGP